MVTGALLVVAAPLLYLIDSINPTPFSTSIFQFSAFRLNFLDLMAGAEVTGICSVIQGYGLWKMKTWSWWLYVAFIIFRFALMLINPSLKNENQPHLLLGDILFLLFLGYMIVRHDLFNVKIPRLITKRK
jgi:hypothetical protein